ncbi:hypothetical protein [Leifsonia xyli]|uniref:hypothetical protein n=1 Tax=Leifsonia xyli TaxID=1575 RepID=UPI001F16D31C|nr:hypothetical protein [Leifsonia xyli]
MQFREFLAQDGHFRGDLVDPELVGHDEPREIIPESLHLDECGRVDALQSLDRARGQQRCEFGVHALTVSTGVVRRV